MALSMHDQAQKNSYQKARSIISYFALGLGTAGGVTATINFLALAILFFTALAIPPVFFTATYVAGIAILSFSGLLLFFAIMMHPKFLKAMGRNQRSAEDLQRAIEERRSREAISEVENEKKRQARLETIVKNHPHVALALEIKEIEEVLAQTKTHFEMRKMLEIKLAELKEKLNFYKKPA